MIVQRFYFIAPVKNNFIKILFTAVFSGLEVIWDRQFGFLKETMFAPISRTEIMIGKTLGGATIAIIQGLIVLSLTYLIGFRIPGLGRQGFQMILNFLIMPRFFLSGALFPTTNLPPVIYFISRSDPLTYGVDGLRGAITGVSIFGIYSDLAAIGALSLLICAIGTALFSKIEA